MFNLKKKTKEQEELFGGMTKEERVSLMKQVRLSPEQRKEFDKMAQEAVDNLNRNVAKEEETGTVSEDRFAGKTEKEISDIMRKARLSPEQRKEFDKMAQEAVDNLNRNVLEEENKLP